jgi:hypothetical protein
VAQLGGNWNNALEAGTWYWNLNNDSSNSNRNNGAHLTLKFVLRKTCCLTNMVEYMTIKLY